MAQAIVLVRGGDPLEGIGGGANYVRAHGRAARRAGFDPHIFCFGRQAGTVDTDFGMVHRTRLPWRVERVPAFRLHNLTVWRISMLARAVESFVLAEPHCRLVHGFSVFGWVSVTVARRLRRKGIEVIPVVSAYDTLVHEAQAKVRGLSRAHGALQRLGFRAELLWARLVLAPLERRGYEGSRRVLINYESVRRLLTQSYGIGDHVSKVPYTSESAFLREGSEGRREVPKAIASLERGEVPLVVSVSRHDPRKGVDVLLQALARLRVAGVSFRACLVGGGLLLAAHRRLAERLGLGTVVAIEGFVPDPYPFLQHADVFVLPSLEEGSGSLSLIEALQAGVPIVASDVDGIPEDVVDGESGILVPSEDESELAAAIGRLIADPTLRQKLGCSARATFEERFSAATFVDALRKTYAELGITPL